MGKKILIAVLLVSILFLAGCGSGDAMHRCSSDDDCMGWRQICYNSEEFNKQYGPAEFPTDQCECINNVCMPTYETYLWLRENANGMNAMAWWDYGPKIEAMGAVPFIKAPSESILDSVGLTHDDHPFVAKRKALQTFGSLETNEKIMDALEFFITTDTNRMQCILKKNDIDLVFLPDEFLSVFPVMLTLMNRFFDVGDNYSRMDFHHVNYYRRPEEQIIEIISATRNICGNAGVAANPYMDESRETFVDGCIAITGKNIYYVSQRMVNSSIMRLLMFKDLDFLKIGYENTFSIPQDNALNVSRQSYHDIIYRVKKDMLICEE